MTLTNREGFICHFLSALSLSFISIKNIEWNFMCTCGPQEEFASSSEAACGRLNEKYQTFHL